MEVDHGRLQLGMTEQFFDGMYIDALIEQMRSEAMAQCVRRISTSLQSGDLHTLCNHVTDGTFMHRPVGNVSFKEKFFWPVIAIIVSQVTENKFWQNRKSILISFTLHDFDLHGCTVDRFDLQEAEFIETKSGTVEESDHTAVFYILYRVEKMDRLLLREDFRQHMIFTWEKFGRQHVRLMQHVFVKEAEALGRDPAFCPTQVKSGLKVVDVKNDVILRDGERIKIVEVAKEKPHFEGVIPDRSFGISTGTQGIGEFDKPRLRSRVQLFRLEIVFLIIIVKFRMNLKVTHKPKPSPKVSVQHNV